MNLKYQTLGTKLSVAKLHISRVTRTLQYFRLQSCEYDFIFSNYFTVQCCDPVLRTERNTNTSQIIHPTLRIKSGIKSVILFS